MATKRLARLVVPISATMSASAAPLTQLLTRSVGHREEVEPDIWTEAILTDDLYLFCSDGLSDALEGSAMAKALQEAVTLEDACKRLVAMAVSAGATDDVTAVLVRPVP